MSKKIIALLNIVVSFSLYAGEITIEKNDSLIRNELFDQKRTRAEQYKQDERERNTSNEYWITQIDPSCGLLKNNQLIYYCAVNGRYYKDEKTTNKRQYRELSTAEVKKIHAEKH
ncbi:hypothetical protein GCM10007916_35720 [Psychromonas marina]|uniref:Uncharacterized protein n=1 Tax=Psychromonas marina TaxID=88364 RepID=A0ABQ6E5B2_9GAMM|nr:hypothetical protein [Psychromonas marina]GLS92500.1 hypothetical protein GCM10007916_35720 [Psychromonas marina]